MAAPSPESIESIVIDNSLVLGPRPIRLGFIGAPIASATSLILISLLSLFCGVYYSSRKAWHPISTRMFSNVGLVARLGLSGVGMQEFDLFLPAIAHSISIQDKSRLDGGLWSSLD